MPKKKILHIAYHSLANGGIQAVIMGIVRNLHNDFSFDVLVFTDRASYYDDEFLRYGKIHRIPFDRTGKRLHNILENFSRPFRSLLYTYFILREGNYDAVHCHNGPESGISLLAAQFAGVPVRIAHSHNTASTEKRPIWVRLYKNITRTLININSSVRVGCSKIANDYLFGEDHIEAFVINNAIDMNKFDQLKYGTESRNTSLFRFIHVGRYCYQKNQLFLLDVFKMIQGMLPNSELDLIGFGEDEDKIKEKIVTLNLQDHVNMLPPDSDIPLLLSRSDYFILTSKFEGLGIVLLEAQVMGVKCFVSDVVPPEANMGLCTYLPLQIGARGWAKTVVEYIINNQSNLHRVSNELKKRYDIEEIVKIYAEIYETGQISNRGY